jgi:sarcosine oxidase
MDTDVVVVGAGAAGSSTAWNLAARGTDVVLLERYSRGHAHGSSHGATRIFRVAYREAMYSRLAGEAIPLWRALERASGQSLLEQTGQLDHGDPEAIDEIEATLRAGGWGFERLTPEQARERWPGMEFDQAVIYSPDGGRIFADRTVEALLALSEQAGAEVRFGEPVLALEPHGEGVRVLTDASTITARVAVVAAGGWLPRMAGLDRFGITLPRLQVTAQAPVHFGIRPGFAFPSYVHHVGTDAVDHTFAYGAYGLESPGEGVKVGLDSMEVIDDVSTRTLDVPESAIAAAVDYAQRWLPGADTDVASAVSCLFTMTDDSHFILDRRGPIVVVSPCSGHGFKFTPILGALTADVALGSDTWAQEWRLPA